MVMAPLLWRFAVTHGGFSPLKSWESAKAGLIQVRVIQPEKYTMFFNFTWPGVVVQSLKKGYTLLLNRPYETIHLEDRFSGIQHVAIALTCWDQINED